MTKNEAKKISQLINGLMVYDNMARNILDSEDYKHEEFRSAVKWFNEQADELIAMGISVNKYEVQD